jgi:hypothetical protein
MGLALAVLGIVIFAVQISRQRLAMPWYMPAMASLGVVLVVASLLERRTVWRVLGLLAILLLTSAEVALVYMSRLPPYTGPIAVGEPFPTFQASRSDGAPFTEPDLAGDRNNVMVFFRGRW